ncbi:hypothetical protein A9Q84_07205 [Halobacteriovorax marinus]|uniref:Uncharacterized protein n=1 Tax=Halobacteriovorax marinus TaxID=97084 RepID=A0A1Y5F9G0_9BACT|nr:hypothetical protein A9Q84_07205 [Halobacteriovorax marinus]
MINKKESIQNFIANVLSLEKHLSEHLQNCYKEIKALCEKTNLETDNLFSLISEIDANHFSRSPQINIENVDYYLKKERVLTHFDYKTYEQYGDLGYELELFSFKTPSFSDKGDTAFLNFYKRLTEVFIHSLIIFQYSHLKRNHSLVPHYYNKEEKKRISTDLNKIKELKESLSSNFYDQKIFSFLEYSSTLDLLEKRLNQLNSKKRLLFQTAGIENMPLRLISQLLFREFQTIPMTKKLQCSIITSFANILIGDVNPIWDEDKTSNFLQKLKKST